MQSFVSPILMWNSLLIVELHSVAMNLDIFVCVSVCYWYCVNRRGFYWNEQRVSTAQTCWALLSAIRRQSACHQDDEVHAQYAGDVKAKEFGRRIEISAGDDKNGFVKPHASCFTEIECTWMAMCKMDADVLSLITTYSEIWQWECLHTQSIQDNSSCNS